MSQVVSNILDMILMGAIAALAYFGVGLMLIRRFQRRERRSAPPGQSGT